LAVVKAAEHAMAKQSPWSQERRVDVGGRAIDRADDLQAQKVGQHPVRQVQEGAHLVAIVRSARHECRIRVLQNNHEFAIGVAPALFRPEADELRFGQDPHEAGRNEAKKAVRFL
jgi:hypothetical protein